MTSAATRLLVNDRWDVLTAVAEWVRNVRRAWVRHRRRVILIPFNFAVRAHKSHVDIAYDRRHGDVWRNTSTFRDFPKKAFEIRFEEFFLRDPEIYKVRCRYLSGILTIYPGADLADPDGDLIAIWACPFFSGYCGHLGVFYVDGEFWAGDIVDDNRTNYGVGADTAKFSVRLLFRVRQNPRYEHLVFHGKTP